jgi:hypothetical protein
VEEGAQRRLGCGGEIGTIIACSEDGGRGHRPEAGRGE